MAYVPGRRSFVAAASSFSIVDRPLGYGNPGSARQPKVHLWTVRNEDRGALPFALAQPAEEQVHETQVRGGVDGAEGLVEEQEPQPRVTRGALDAQDLSREYDALPLSFRERADGSGEHLFERSEERRVGKECRSRGAPMS